MNSSKHLIALDQQVIQTCPLTLYNKDEVAKSRSLKLETPR